MSGISGAGNIITDGLVLHLDVANPKSYVSGSTTWGDLSGSRNNGTLVNGVGYSSSNAGTLTFDGTNDRVSLPNPIQNLPFTINVWFNISVRKNFSLFTSRSLLGRGISIFGVGTSQSNIRFDTGTNQWTTGYLTPLNSWVNLTLTADLNYKTLYVNGIYNSQTSDKYNLTDNYTVATIGCSSINELSGDNFFNGLMSNVMIYNRALTQQEITQNYNVLKNRYI